MSEIKVNKISQRSGTAITLGNSGTDFQLPSGADIVAQSGSTITIAAGATITNSGTATGFGRTGTVNWDTTKKTTGFTAVSGVGYFCDTTGGAFTATLPATPTAGDIVAFKDYSNTFATNNLTVGRNGSNIEGLAVDSIQNIAGQSITLIYIDATEGWSIIYSAQYSDLNQAQYVAATGGTISTCGDYKVHTFTGPGTFTVTNAGNTTGSNKVDYLVVAGGGGGGSDNYPARRNGGAGGAGGFRLSNSYGLPAPTTSPLATPTGITVTATAYPITVGAGGTAGTNSPSCAVTVHGGQGNSAIFSTITSAGGGAGGGEGSNPSGTPFPVPNNGAGGSGGGNSNASQPAVGQGNTPPVAPPQGNPAGLGSSGDNASYNAGGGGGAGAQGGNASPAVPGGGGSGGVGSFISPSFAGPNGTPGPAPGVKYFAGGGGSKEGGTGGSGGGGNGAPSPTLSGTANTGGGGGGIRASTAGTGGSGIVIIRYKFQ